MEKERGEGKGRRKGGRALHFGKESECNIRMKTEKKRTDRRKKNVHPLVFIHFMRYPPLPVIFSCLFPSLTFLSSLLFVHTLASFSISIGDSSI